MATMAPVEQAGHKRLGRSTLKFTYPPAIAAAASVVGPMEGKGPLGAEFDEVKSDALLGEKTWEKAESKMLEEAVQRAVQKAGWQITDVDFLLAGDLLNQIISASFAARQIGIPYLGLYGACSTLTLGMGLGAMTIDGGYARRVVVGTSSHHDAAERQYRYPTELGVQRPPTSHWTVTGAGAVTLAAGGSEIRVTHATFGKVWDLGLKDPNDMGSPMAPAAADTIAQHLEDTHRSADYYDRIVTGDLGRIGLPVAIDLLEQRGHKVRPVMDDCGVMIYDPGQDVHAGGSGCGCSAAVFSSYLLEQLRTGAWRRLLMVSTGCLHSPTSYQQGESLPTVAHAVAVERVD